MRVIMFETGRTIWDLEKQINNFISNHSSKDIIDIKYSCSGETSYRHYTAMIILKD